MSTNITEAQVARLFEQMNKSPVRDAVKELKKAMQPAKQPSTADKTVLHRVVLTNGTGRTERVAEYAELERGSY